jgi:FlaA1/EpsC-like NDP-sugar epimerase
MGATKRIAEGIVHEVAVETGKKFVSVRFGNVLGSRGSVVPTFLRQIAAGGPVTVTHPEMRRYFMTIPEAVQLVLQAGAIGNGEETFVLDMGEPVKVADLAADLIRLSGLEVGTDIEIHFTGMRPGEKLYEELFFSSENAVPTSHPKILRGRNAEFPRDAAYTVGELVDAALRHVPSDALRERVSLLVPEYEPPRTLEIVARASSGYERRTGTHDRALRVMP